MRERHRDLFKSACEQARERDRKAKKGRQDAAVAAAAERQRMEVPSLALSVKKSPHFTCRFHHTPRMADFCPWWHTQACCLGC